MLNEKQVKNVLVKAKQLLEEKGWTQKLSARNSSGKFVSMHSIDAVCFCSLGAISVFSSFKLSDPIFDESCQKLQNVISSIDGDELSNIVEWNDDPHRTKEEVLEAFQKAIDSCKVN